MLIMHSFLPIISMFFQSNTEHFFKPLKIIEEKNAQQRSPNECGNKQMTIDNVFKTKRI